ncbi:MAG TPA: succinylglutamate desuccinylase/aspartoacylase family protein [Pyrinomonadaceae bacterium]|nr:succinylglutamate desuccinylase/aspartoacylase family protein [Pyrinomonadaceae bacterium]
MGNLGALDEGCGASVMDMAQPASDRRGMQRDRHLIGAHTHRRIGPTLIVVAGLHGNEAGGVEAIRKIRPEIDALRDKLRGRVYLVAGNTRALTTGKRFVDTDLNRAWTRENLASLGTAELCRKSEGVELTELESLFDSILVTAKNEVYVLDLHSTSAEGVPFATVGDTLRNRHFAQDFPVRIILGIEERLSGTMLESLNNAGCVTLGFEGGSHTAVETVENHAAMIWIALVNAGILWEEDVPQLDEYKAQLAKYLHGPRIIEVRHREPVKPADNFVMNAGYRNFDPVVKGDLVATNRYGEVRARESGLMIMPLYQRLGEDGFFLGRGVARFWIFLSEMLRRMGVPDIVERLPGVTADPGDRETLTIDTRVARFFPLQIFHLLGFRRRKWVDKKLVVSRRRHDIVSPFLPNQNGG